MTFCLQYKPHARIEDLAAGECTIHRAGDGSGKRWWNLWFYVARETDGQLEDLVVPVHPGGDYDPNGPGGKTWGFKKTGVGIWSVSPSIAFSQHPEIRAPNGELAQLSGKQVRPDEVMRSGGVKLWHQTPDVVDVPDGEPWAPGGSAAR